MAEFPFLQDSGPRAGQRYKIGETTVNSRGETGKTRIYENGDRIFIVDPPISAAAQYAAPAPAPAPAPAAPAPPAPEPKPASSGSPQPTTGGAATASVQGQTGDAQAINWQINDQAGSPRFGQRYHVEEGTDSTGRPGKWHVYEDGSKQFVDETQPSGAVAAAEQAAAAPAPAPAPEAAPAPPAPEVSNGTGGAQAPAEVGISRAIDVVGNNTHTVVSGDTLSGIAEARGMSLSEIIALNPQIEDPNLIFPGQQVNLGVADEATVSGSSEAVGFPTSSSYDQAANQPSTRREATDKVSGWTEGPGDVAADPASGAMNIAKNDNTDPLDINGNKAA